jgi:hypothetical protein
MPNVDNLDFVHRAIAVITKPSEFFKEKFTEDLGTPVVHVAIVTLISSILGIIFGLFIQVPLQLMAGGSVPEVIIATLIGGVFAVILAPILGVIGWAIGSGIWHIFVILVGGKGGLKRTAKVMAYVSTINILTSIPLIGLLAWFYGLYLTWVGFKTQHNLTGMRAAIAILIPIILVLILIILLIIVIGAAALAAFGSMGGLEGLQNLVKT